MNSIETQIDMQRMNEEADSAMRMLVYAVGSIVLTFAVALGYVCWRLFL